MSAGFASAAECTGPGPAEWGRLAIVMRRWPYIALGASVLALDRLTKWLVLRGLSLGESFPVVDGVIRVTHIRNPGGAFGILPQHRAAFLIMSGGVAAVLTMLLAVGVPGGRWLRVGVALLCAGAWGNFIDRFAYGSVIDFIEIPRLTVFNVADSAVVLGAVALALGLVWRSG